MKTSQGERSSPVLERLLNTDAEGKTGMRSGRHRSGLGSLLSG